MYSFGALDEDTVSIEGTISRTFNTLSNLILPSAVAASGRIDRSTLRDRYQELKKEKHEGQLNLLGDKELMLKIFQNSKLVPIASEILEAHAKAKDESDRFSLAIKLAYYSIDYGTIEHPLLVCRGQSASVESPKNGVKYVITYEAANDEALAFVDKESEYASFEDPEQAKKHVEVLVSKILELSKTKGINVGLKLRIRSEVAEVSSCEVYGLGLDGDATDNPDELIRDSRILEAVDIKTVGSFEEGEKLLEDAANKTLKDLYKRMLEAGLKEGAEEWNKIWDDQSVQNKDHHSKRLKELKDFFEGLQKK